MDLQLICTKKGRNVYRVFRTDRYDKKFLRLDYHEKILGDVIEKKLKLEPYSSKHLGLPFFVKRSLKIKESSFWSMKNIQLYFLCL